MTLLFKTEVLHPWHGIFGLYDSISGRYNDLNEYFCDLSAMYSPSDLDCYPGSKDILREKEKILPNAFLGISKLTDIN